jgi:hypothetical protein
LQFVLHTDIESDFGEINFGNVRFWAKNEQKIFPILEKTTGVVSKW